MVNKSLILYQDIAILKENIADIIDFSKIFNNRNPVHIEIGSGKGTFLLNQAQKYPEINFFGIEWANQFYKFAVDRIGRWGLKNVKILRDDATVFIAKNVPAESISCFHIYFPDPWHKRKHNNRRFVSEKNLAQIHKILIQNGIINIATDHKDYFNWMQKEFAKLPNFFVLTDYIIPAGAVDDEIAGTNFERKYIKEGRMAYTLAMKKI